MGSSERRGGLTAGIILIIIGVALLLINLGLFTPGVFVLALGASFLVAYAFWRAAGFLIPGMILTWLGLAITLTESNVFRGIDMGSIVTIAIGLAFISIYAFMTKRHWWPLVPGGILLIIGTTTLLVTENIIPLTVTQLVNIIWPALLILVGIWLIIRQLYRQ